MERKILLSELSILLLWLEKKLLFEFINEGIGHIIEGGIFMHINKNIARDFFSYIDDNLFLLSASCRQLSIS